jgi:hypothetical protein
MLLSELFTQLRLITVELDSLLIGQGVLEHGDRLASTARPPIGLGQLVSRGQDLGVHRDLDRATRR